MRFLERYVVLGQGQQWRGAFAPVAVGFCFNHGFTRIVTDVEFVGIDW